MSHGRWRILCGHAVGPRKKVYQDHADAETLPGDAVVLAVADGHGSAAHAHSHVGARYAVEVFVRLAREFADHHFDCASAHMICLRHKHRAGTTNRDRHHGGA